MVPWRNGVLCVTRPSPRDLATVMAVDNLTTIALGWILQEIWVQLKSPHQLVSNKRQGDDEEVISWDTLKIRRDGVERGADI